MSSKWRYERKRGSVELVRNDLLIYFSISDNCLVFEKNVKDYTNFLKAPTNHFTDMDPLIKVK